MREIAAVAGEIFFLVVCPSERDSAGTPGGNFFKFGTNLHFGLEVSVASTSQSSVTS